MDEDYEMFKIVVIGSTGTGKTNISTRYIKNEFTCVIEVHQLGSNLFTQAMAFTTGSIEDDFHFCLRRM